VTRKRKAQSEASGDTAMPLPKIVTGQYQCATLTTDMARETTVAVHKTYINTVKRYDAERKL
jgi:hypothetical protein